MRPMRAPGPSTYSTSTVSRTMSVAECFRIPKPFFKRCTRQVVIQVGVRLDRRLQRNISLRVLRMDLSATNERQGDRSCIDGGDGHLANRTIASESPLLTAETCANRLTSANCKLCAPNLDNSGLETSARSRAIVGSWSQSSSDPKNAKIAPVRRDLRDLSSLCL
jgi:hypothetical protein